MWFMNFILSKIRLNKFRLGYVMLSWFKVMLGKVKRNVKGKTWNCIIVRKYLCLFDSKNELKTIWLNDTKT